MYKSSSRLNIILIDDNENDLDVAAEALEKFDFVNVKSFADAEEASVFLQEACLNNSAENYSLILLDLNMPKKNGFELLKEIKSNPALSQYPVLIYTSSKRKDDIKKAYLLGASSYLLKPTDLDDIKELFKGVVHYWTKVAVF